METYSSFQKPVVFIYFWLNYCNENHIERIPVGVKNIDHLLRMVNETIKADNLHLFLLSDGTRIDNNEYLESLKYGTELIVCTEEQIQNLLIYFELKRYLSFKNISYDALYSKITFMFIWSGYKRYMASLVQSVFTDDFEQAKDSGWQLYVFFIKVFTTSKEICSLTCINTNLRS